MQSFPIVDAALLQELASLRRDGVEVLGELYRIFIRDAALHLASLTAATDHVVVAQQAHRLRGSSGALGFAALAHACERLENAALEGREDIAPFLATVQAAYVDAEAVVGIHRRPGLWRGRREGSLLWRDGK